MNVFYEKVTDVSQLKIGDVLMSVSAREGVLVDTLRIVTSTDPLSSHNMVVAKNFFALAKAYKAAVYASIVLFEGHPKQGMYIKREFTSAGSSDCFVSGRDIHVDNIHLIGHVSEVHVSGHYRLMVKVSLLTKTPPTGVITGRVAPVHQDLQKPGHDSWPLVLGFSVVSAVFLGVGFSTSSNENPGVFALSLGFGLPVVVLTCMSWVQVLRHHSKKILARMKERREEAHRASLGARKPTPYYRNCLEAFKAGKQQVN